MNWLYCVTSSPAVGSGHSSIENYPWKAPSDVDTCFLTYKEYMLSTLLWHKVATDSWAVVVTPVDWLTEHRSVWIICGHSWKTRIFQQFLAQVTIDSVPSFKNSSSLLFGIWKSTWKYCTLIRRKLLLFDRLDFDVNILSRPSQCSCNEDN